MDMSRHYLWTWPLGKGNTGQAGQQGSKSGQKWPWLLLLLRLLASKELKMGREGTRGDRTG
jgi:hypothetical protein